MITLAYLDANRRVVGGRRGRLEKRPTKYARKAVTAPPPASSSLRLV